MDTVLETLLIRVRDGVVDEKIDQVVAEAVFSLIVNDTFLVSLQCTPSDLDAMAVGFLFTEKILVDPADLEQVEVSEALRQVRVVLRSKVNPEMVGREKRTRTSGCGQGITFTNLSDINGMLRPAPGFSVAVSDILRCMEQFRTMSRLFMITGGAHCAALARGSEVLFAAEDIGRHNAVDKLIGMSILKGVSRDAAFLLSTGRVSGEIITKTIRAGIPVLVSRAAPTCMSVTLAEEHGVTLVGFARGSRLNVYTHPQRLLFDVYGDGARDASYSRLPVMSNNDVNDL